LYFIGPYHNSSVDMAGEVQLYDQYARDLPMALLPVCELFSVAPRGDGLFFTPLARPVGDRVHAYVDFSGIDSAFQSLHLNRTLQRSVVGINDNHQCLVSGSSSPGLGSRFYRIEIGMPDPGDGRLFPLDTLIIDIEDPTLANYELVEAVVGIDDYFLLSFSGDVFKVYPDGTYRKVLNTSVFSFFQHEDTLFAPKQFNQLYFSTDAGESWRLLDNFPSFIETARYVSVGDSLVFSRGDRISTLKIIVNGPEVTYRIRELENKGLEGHLIGTITPWQDDVSVGTPTGVFSRSFSLFFASKRQE